jgi:L-ascorbate metabolism protein UlaG (beta-lactamase superfamily)
MLVTHAHGDHYDDSQAIANTQKIQMWAPPGFTQTLYELGLFAPPSPQNTPRDLSVTKGRAEAPRMNKGGTNQPGRHQDHHGARRAFELENGFTIYHMGDTALFADLQWIAERFKPDLVLIPIGGHYTMGPVDAGAATRIPRPKYAIPMHYGTTGVLNGTPDENARAIGDARTRVITLEPGGKTSF